MKGGILIIGSLFWEDHHADRMNWRLDWRKKRLKMKNSIHVFAPIRYGRKSGFFYTMVLSKQAELENKWGTAFFVPFKNEMSSFKGIAKQAEYLSLAEGTGNSRLIKGGQEKWCILGILFNPAFDKKKKYNILQLFEKKLIDDGHTNECEEFKINTEHPILSRKGEINIAWPKAVNSKMQKELDSFDFILATCTNPEPKQGGYPSSKAIKECLVRDTRNYFFNNVRNGITSYQDREISYQDREIMDLL